MLSQGLHKNVRIFNWTCTRERPKHGTNFVSGFEWSTPISRVKDKPISEKLTKS